MAEFARASHVNSNILQRTGTARVRPAGHNVRLFTIGESNRANLAYENGFIRYVMAYFTRYIAKQVLKRKI